VNLIYIFHTAFWKLWILVCFFTQPKKQKGHNTNNNNKLDTNLFSGLTDGNNIQVYCFETNRSRNGNLMSRHWGDIYINRSQKVSFSLYYRKTNYCSQLLLCNTLVSASTATWQMSPPVQHHMGNGNCIEWGNKGKSAWCSPVPVCTKHRTLR